MAQALIVIDIQEGLVKENPYNAKNFISNTKAIIQHFRDQNIEVIFIRHSEAEGVNVNIRMYNFDDVQCTVIPSVAYGFVTGMNLQLC